MKQCTNCHAVIADDAAFCTTCGHKLEASTAPATGAATPASGAFSSAPTTPAAPQFAPSPAPQPAKSGLNKNVLIGIGAASALVIAVAFFFIGRLTATPATNSSTTSTYGTPSSGTAAGSSNTVDYASAQTASLGAYSFSIPDDYYYETAVEGGYQAIAIVDSTESWAAAIIYMDDVPYAGIESNLADIASALGGSAHGSTTVGGTDFYYVDADQGYTYWFSPAGSKTFMTVTISASGATDHSVIEKVEPIIASATNRNLDRSTPGEGSISERFNFGNSQSLNLPTE